MTTKEKAVATLQEFAIVKLGEQEVRSIVQANVGRVGGMSEFDLERIKVPGSGGTTWEIQTLTGESEAVKSISGVIVGWKDSRSYWAESFGSSGGGTPPDCTSQDLITGIGKPGGHCPECPFAQFGSAVNDDGSQGDGQACRQTRAMLLLRPEDLLPVVIVAAPSSLRSVKGYFLRLASRGIPYYAVVTEFGLERDKNKKGIAYARMVPSVASILSAEEAKTMEGYVKVFDPALAGVEIQREEALG